MYTHTDTYTRDSLCMYMYILLSRNFYMNCRNEIEWVRVYYINAQYKMLPTFIQNTCIFKHCQHFNIKRKKGKMFRVLHKDLISPCQKQ